MSPPASDNPPRPAGRRKRPRKDWCRNPDWSVGAREKFFLRLSSVRQPVKYLRRKAGYLLDKHPAAAMALLGYAREQATALSDQVGARREFAHAALACAQPHDAAIAWQEALAIAGEDPLWVQTAIEYMAFVAGHQYSDAYDEAARLADQLNEQLLDAIQRFLYYATRALLAAARNHGQQARLDANSALDAHRQFASTPRNFPEAGITDERATWFYSRLFALAGTPSILASAAPAADGAA